MEVSARLEIQKKEFDLERILPEYARVMGGSYRSDATGRRVIFTGTRGAIHPNELRMTTTVRPSPSEVHIVMSSSAWPWEKRKIKRILDYRLTQLLDYLQTSHRGSNLEPFSHPSWIRPFCLMKRPAAFHGSLIACLWIFVSALAALAFGLIASWLMGMALISDLIGALTQRSLLIESLGEYPLPSLAELSQFGTGPVVSAALVFALPIPCVISFMLALFLVFEEVTERLAGVSAWLAAACSIILGMTLWPMTSVWVALAFSILVPLASVLGYRLMWSWKGEHRVPSSSSPAVTRWGWKKIALAAGGLLLVGIVVGSGLDLSRDFVRFRDRALLSGDGGLPPVHFYYRHAFYPAELIKPVFSTDGRAERQQKAVLIMSSAQDPALERILRRRQALVHQWDAQGLPARLPHYDLVLCDGIEKYEQVRQQISSDRCLVLLTGSSAAPPGMESIRKPWTPDQMEAALQRVSDRTFAGAHLASLASLGFMGLAVLLPAVTLGVVILFFLLMMSMVHRKFSRRAAWFVTALVLVFAGLIVLSSLGSQGERQAAVKEIRDAGRATPPHYDVLYNRLKDPHPAIRYEAACVLAKVSERHPDRRPESVGPLMALLIDPDIRVRMWVARTLGLMKAKTAVLPLMKRLDQDDLLVKARAAEALGMIGDVSALEILNVHLKSDPWYVGSYCLEAIRRLKSR